MRCLECGNYRHGAWFGIPQCRCDHPRWEPLVSDSDPGDETKPDFNCVRCGEAYAVDEHGLCGHCHWATAQEIQQGFKDLDAFLAHYAPWSEYQVAHNLI